ncbi:uncharacterized protein [Ambystoma mexicanum]|uniref:uncharacterized protein n=1 Tax=Ambystoma mexicanum TaxID=8296 RepID=UPI0037E9145B
MTTQDAPMPGDVASAQTTPRPATSDMAWTIDLNSPKYRITSVCEIASCAPCTTLITSAATAITTGALLSTTTMSVATTSTSPSMTSSDGGIMTIQSTAHTHSIDMTNSTPPIASPSNMPNNETSSPTESNATGTLTTPYSTGTTARITVKETSSTSITDISTAVQPPKTSAMISTADNVTATNSLASVMFTKSKSPTSPTITSRDPTIKTDETLITIRTPYDSSVSTTDALRTINETEHSFPTVTLTVTQARDSSFETASTTRNVNDSKTTSVLNISNPIATDETITTMTSTVINFSTSTQSIITKFVNDTLSTMPSRTCRTRQPPIICPRYPSPPARHPRPRSVLLQPIKPYNKTPGPSAYHMRPIPAAATCFRNNDSTTLPIRPHHQKPHHHPPASQAIKPLRCCQVPKPPVRYNHPRKSAPGFHRSLQKTHCIQTPSKSNPNETVSATNETPHSATEKSKSSSTYITTTRNRTNDISIPVGANETSPETLLHSTTEVLTSGPNFIPSTTDTTKNIATFTTPGLQLTISIAISALRTTDGFTKSLNGTSANSYTTNISVPVASETSRHTTTTDVQTISNYQQTFSSTTASSPDSFFTSDLSKPFDSEETSPTSRTTQTSMTVLTSTHTGQTMTLTTDCATDQSISSVVVTTSTTFTSTSATTVTDRPLLTTTCLSFTCPDCGTLDSRTSPRDPSTTVPITAHGSTEHMFSDFSDFTAKSDFTRSPGSSSSQPPSGETSISEPVTINPTSSNAVSTTQTSLHTVTGTETSSGSSYSATSPRHSSAGMTDFCTLLNCQANLYFSRILTVHS